MKLASILLIMLLNQGHWLSGRDNAVTFRWLLDRPMPAAVFHWELALDRATLAQGNVEFQGAIPAQGASISVVAPAVRVRTEALWRWQLKDKADGKLIGSGVETVYLYPDNLLDGVAQSVKGRRVVVCDAPGELPALLDKAKVDFQRIDGLQALATTPADIVLVGQNQIENVPFAQQPLPGVAANGASVMIFRQTKPPALTAYILAAKAVPPTLRWRDAHPLLAGMDRDLIASWLDSARASGQILTALRLPADEPALELAFWPAEQPGGPPAAIDALLAVKSIGRGRIVFCQLPLGPWASDPRSQMFLAGAMEYLAGPPGPTLPPSKRPEKSDDTELPAAKPPQATQPQGDLP